MPRNPVKTYVFEHPLITSASLWFITTIPFFVLSFERLIPLGEKKANASGNRDSAQKQYDEALAQLNNDKATLQAAETKVRDLDCAILGMPGFNDGALEFQKRLLTKLNGTTPLEFLSSGLLMNFVPDKTENKQTVVAKTYSEQEQYWGRVYRCTYACSGNQSCCYVSGWQWRTVWQHYNEFTIVKESTHNIIQGSGTGVVPLQCGGFSRDLQVQAARTVITYQSPTVRSGTRKAGAEYINYEVEKGSEIPLFYTLNGSPVSLSVTVPKATSQAVAAENVVTQIIKFIATAISAFQVLGVDYPALRNSTQDSIPAYQAAVASSTTFFNQKQGLLTDRMAEFDVSGTYFNNGLSLWLSLLIVLPLTLAGVSCCFLMQCKENCMADEPDPSTEMTPV